jgi:hypothetical protein
MLTNRIRNLAPPPRRVPLPVVVSAMLGTTGWFGALFLIMGLGFTLIFTQGYRPFDDLRIVLSRTSVQGTIRNVKSVNASENDVEVYEYEYAFTTRGGQKVTGHSYSTGREWGIGSTVNVEYVPDEPSISRIQGTRTSLFSPFVLFVLIFPLVGAAMFLIPAYGGIRQVLLLRNGLVGDARILSAQPTGVSVNNTPVLKYSYEVTTSSGVMADGAANAFPSGRIGDEEAEPALYLPSNPGRSTLIDAIATRFPLDVDPSSGQWISTEGKLKSVLYLLAWAVTLLLGGYWFLATLGLIR